MPAMNIQRATILPLFFIISPSPLTFAAEIENGLILGHFSTKNLLLKALYGKSW